MSNVNNDESLKVPEKFKNRKPTIKCTKAYIQKSDLNSFVVLFIGSFNQTASYDCI